MSTKSRAKQKNKEEAQAKRPAQAVRNISDLADELEARIAESKIVEQIRVDHDKIVIDPLNIVYRTRTLEVMTCYLRNNGQATFLLLQFPWTKIQGGVTQEYVDEKFERAGKILALVAEAGIHNRENEDGSMVLKI